MINELTYNEKQIKTGKPENIYYGFYKGRFVAVYSAMGNPDGYFRQQLKVRNIGGNKYNFNPDFIVVSKAIYDKHPEDYIKLKPYVDEFWDRINNESVNEELIIINENKKGMKIKLQDLTIDIIQQAFPDVFAKSYGHVSFPNASDSTTSVRNERDLANWKQGIMNVYGNVELELNPEAKEWFNKVKVLDPKFIANKEKYTSAKMSYLDSERAAGRTSGLDENQSEVEYLMSKFYEYRNLAAEAVANGAKEEAADFNKQAMEYYERAMDLEVANMSSLSPEDQAMVDDYEEEEANREVPRDYASMYENETKNNKMKNIDLNRWAKLAGINENNNNALLKEVKEVPNPDAGKYIIISNKKNRVVDTAFDSQKDASDYLRKNPNLHGNNAGLKIIKLGDTHKVYSTNEELSNPIKGNEEWEGHINGLGSEGHPKVFDRMGDIILARYPEEGNSTYRMEVYHNNNNEPTGASGGFAIEKGNVYFDFKFKGDQVVDFDFNEQKY